MSVLRVFVSLNTFIATPAVPFAIAPLTEVPQVLVEANAAPVAEPCSPSTWETIGNATPTVSVKVTPAPAQVVPLAQKVPKSNPSPAFVVDDAV